MSRSLSSIEKLNDAIDKELSWRKQELALIRSQMYMQPNDGSVAFFF